MVIRYRIDGALRIVRRIHPKHLIVPIVSRIKIMSQLDISEHRLPQDGRIVFSKFKEGATNFDLRVAISPANFGEKVVMRLLDKQKSLLPLEEMGFSARDLILYRQKIRTPYGMILHVGPTGSGKSMTLYAALNEIQTPEINIQTIEDPIEYTLQGITQVQINPDYGLTFSRILRTFLRQDPNVILVGEIRDRETAEIAVASSLTGHLLLSTLHTNDAPSTIIRLVEMGVEPFMVSNSLVCVCAQRLLRRLCPKCKKAFEPIKAQQLLCGLDPDVKTTLYRPHGCQMCNETGYKKRIGSYEILVPNDKMRSMINQKNCPVGTLKHMAVEECGMTTLYWDAMEKVRQGITSIEEVSTKICKDEFDSRPRWMSEELVAVKK